MDTDWGNVRAWVAVLAGAGAGAIGLRTLVAAETERRRQQASRVAAWVGWDVRGDKRFFGAYVRNTSELPVYQSQLWFEHRNFHDSVPLMQYVGTIPPTSEPVFHYVEDVPEDANEYLYGVSIIFTDSDRRRWIRRFDGALIRFYPRERALRARLRLAGLKLRIADLKPRFHVPRRSKKHRDGDDLQGVDRAAGLPDDPL